MRIRQGSPPPFSKLGSTAFAVRLVVGLLATGILGAGIVGTGILTTRTVRAEGLGTAQIPQLDPDIQFAIDTMRQRLADEEASDLVGDLQDLHDRLWGKNFLYHDAVTGRGHRCLTSIDASDFLGGLIRSLPEDAITIYRSSYDLAARSLYARALELGDIEQLVASYERYPASSVAAIAALQAGDAFLEAGDELRAWECWGFIRDDAPMEVRRERSRRGLLSASLAGSPLEYDRWVTEWAATTTDGGAETPGIPRPGSAPGTADPLAGIPELPFRSAAIGWMTVQFKQASLYDPYYDIHYARLPCVHDDWLAISTFRLLHRYNLRNGKTLGGRFKLPSPVNFNDYEEQDRHLRSRPVTDGEVLVTSYVAEVSRPEEFFGYAIRIAIPQRGLKGVAVGTSNELWDTASEESDPILAELSFNSTPVIVGDRLYALGWRESGYVVSYLVCLDLKTGKPLWKTILAGNQIELTMFGEIAMEPFLGEILVEDGVVYAVTNLGIVAAVRARDGRFRWIAEYPSLEVQPAMRRRGRTERQNRWARNPIVSFGDRVIATPFDSTRALSLDKKTGRVLQSVSSSSVGPSRGPGIYLLGRHAQHLVFCTGDTVVLLLGRDLQTEGPRLDLQRSTDARPGLARGGIVYTTKDQGALRYRPFRAREEVELFAGSDGDGVTDGAVTVLDDRILVTNSYKVRCYVKSEKRPLEDGMRRR